MLSILCLSAGSRILPLLPIVACGTACVLPTILPPPPQEKEQARPYRLHLAVHTDEGLPMAENATLCSGQGFTLDIYVDRDIYFYIFQQAGDHYIEKLYPHHHTARIPAGRVRIPTRSTEVFTLDDQTGLEQLYFVASEHALHVNSLEIDAALATMDHLNAECNLAKASSPPSMSIGDARTKAVGASKPAAPAKKRRSLPPSKPLPPHLRAIKVQSRINVNKIMMRANEDGVAVARFSFCHTDICH